VKQYSVTFTDVSEQELAALKFVVGEQMCSKMQVEPQ
jgi:hypothetical protein